MTDAVMSQEEIDALVGADPDPLETAASAPAPAESAPDSAPAAAAPAPDPDPDPEPAAPTPTLIVPATPTPAPTPTLVVSADSSGTSDITQRLTSLEATVAALQQSAGGGQNDAAIQALNQQVQALSAQMNQLVQHLQNSLGFGLRGSFQCGTCNAQGLVGSRVSCMHCGTESWIGWSA